MSAPNHHLAPRTVLVANRGEIAARVLRACREARIRCAVVVSEADRAAPYLADADEAVFIGPAPAADSYLSIERVLAAARSVGATDLHPGYGFLSENAEFAGRCAEAGITFIGPPAEVIRALGDKSAAKRIAEDAGVPVVPGYYGADQSDEALGAEAVALGAPLIIKAAAGGGGRGMRVVEDLAEFDPHLRDARREAIAAFGRGDVLLERFLARPRHVEIQIMGDASGTVHALHERECSIQRRHQKVLEESPSPGLDPAVRAAMCDAAVRLAQAAGYRSAGTVEFLLDGSGPSANYYFLEVNTRLQVEHPVTEMRTGLDLVRLQLDIAAGLPTPLLRSPAAALGHAIEVRICSEDPERNFAPSTGRLECWREPRGPGVRVDSGVSTGSVVSQYYDPMLAKLIVHGADRAEAVERLEGALERFHAIGVDTNIAYLLAIVRDPAFRSGETHIRFTQERMSGWRRPREVPHEVLLALAAVQLGGRQGLAGPSGDGTRPMARARSAWDECPTWRNA